MSHDQTHMHHLYLQGCDIRVRPRLAEHAWMGVGGVVPYMIAPRSVDACVRALSYLAQHEIDYRILGAWSNLLIADGELDFVVVSTKHLSSVTLTDDGLLTAEAGVALMRASLLSAERGRQGLEFGCGIPGSVGGGVYMNAGAYGGELRDVITSVTVYDTITQNKQTLDATDCGFAYRTSIFQSSPHCVILSMTCQLSPSTPDQSMVRVHDLLEQRRSRQPLERPSAGSIFKRPRPDFYVGTAIDEQWLKNTQIGGVMVSPKHAWFMINVGGATFDDLTSLITHVQDRIRDAYGEELEVEPEIWQ